MNEEMLTPEAIKYIIARLLDNAIEARREAIEDRTDLFRSGRDLAYYEMLDILQSELQIYDQDLKEYGIDMNLLEKELRRPGEDE